MKKSKYEPAVIAFSCWHCAYAAADQAGLGRLQYPPNVRIICIPCSGRISLVDIFRAFELGADAVFVGGCLKEGCHYVDGNYKAEKIVNFGKQLLEKLDIGSERLEMHFMGASEGNKFAEAVQEMTERAKKLGPNPLKTLTPPRRSGKVREILRSQIRLAAKHLGKEFKESLIIPEPPGGSGEPIIDIEKCNGCGACEWVCPERAIALEDSEDRRVVHWHWKCTACGLCEEVCEKDAIKIDKKFDLAAFLSDEETVDVRLELANCRSCGRPIATGRQMEEVLDEVKKAGVPLKKWKDTYSICWECRQKPWLG